jgi:hypothetical protein
MNVGVSSEEDIGGLLLSSVGGGGGGGRVGQCMRAVFRKAMDKQFDEAKANARVAAVESGRYVLEENMEARRGDGSCARLKVTYHKGIGFQSYFEDDVELLTNAQLVGVVGSVLADHDAREMLKPGGMAGCSPRVFWSLMFHCGPSAAAAGGAAAGAISSSSSFSHSSSSPTAAATARTVAAAAAGGVEAALRRLVPGQDWGFLHERHRKLSEKALENQQQEEELRQEREEVARQKREQREMRLARKQSLATAAAAAAAAAAVAGEEGGGGGGGGGGKKKKKEKKEEKQGGEEEGEEEVVVVEPNEREVRAQAALARFSKGRGGGGGGGGGGGSAAATAVTAAEGEEEEEEEEEGEVDSDFPEEVSDAWVRVLRCRSINLPTCAALAAADVEELTPKLDQHFVTKKKPLAPCGVTEEEVQKWVSACQSDEMDGMMMLLAQGDEDLLEALECVHVATPKDVKLWAGSVPGALLDMLEQELTEERLKDKVRERLPDVESVREMGRKAEVMMRDHAWLDLWGSE